MRRTRRSASSTLDVAAIGTNHGAGPTVALRALREMRDAGMPLAALPNIGLASLTGRRIVYPHSTPDYFAEFAVQAVALGARIVGGCCGTTPAQIEAIRGAFDAGRTPVVSLEVDEPSLPVAPAVDAVETGLARAFREQSWVVCVELDPPKGGSLDGLVEATRELHASGKVDVVDVNDNPMARARMNALMTSATLQREVGIETIPHVTPRDTTVMGLEGLLLGAHAEGVRNLLAVTGDPPHVGDYPGSRGVYEVDAIGLVQLVSSLNRGEDYVGKGLDTPTSFFVGVAVNPSAADLELELRALPGEDRGRRAFRDDAGALRHRAASTASATGWAAGRCPCSSASGRCGATRWRSGSTTRCPGSPCRRRARRARGGRAGRACGGPRARARARRGRPHPRRRDLRDPAVQAADRRARPAGLTAGAAASPWLTLRSHRVGRQR